MKYLVFGEDDRMTFVREQLVDLGGTRVCIIAPPNEIVTEDFIKNYVLPYPNHILVYGKIDPNAKNLLSNSFCIFNNEKFTMKNAKLTALATLPLINETKKALYDLNILIIGYGRIGASLAVMINNLGGKIDIATTSSVRQAGALADKVLSLNEIDLSNYDVVVNTAPSEFELDTNSVFKLMYIDLTGQSKTLISKLKNNGCNADYYPALPSKVFPKSAGKLICDFIKSEVKE